MTKFARSIIIVMAIAAVIATRSYGSTAGIWAGYIELQVTGGPDAGTAWYGIKTDGGATQPAHFLTANANNTPTLNLGNITGLEVLSAELLTYKNGENVSSETINWSVKLNGPPPSGSYTSENLNFGHNAQFTDANGNTGIGNASNNDQLWGGDNSTVNGYTAQNVLNGLSLGTYEMDVYGSGNSDNGGIYLNNDNGSNYGLLFTIVPEPSSISLVILGLLGALGMIRRRKA